MAGSTRWTALQNLALGALWLTSGCAGEPTPAAPADAARSADSATFDVPPHDPCDDGGAPSSFPSDLPKTAEMYWLTQIGWGRAQTARVCARGNQDPVAQALCACPLAISGFEDLLRAFWPNGRILEENYTFGVTYHSAGLAARVVSALNPAVVMMSLSRVDNGDAAGPKTTELTDLAISFTRGEQLVELMGVDIQNQRINLYLLAFGHACHLSDGGCTAADRLGSRSEKDWSSWTLYQAEDIEDTVLTCFSCHQSDGPDTPKHFLMRQNPFPWLHWGKLTEGSRALGCPAGGPRILLSPVPRPDATHLVPDLDTMFTQAHADEAQFAGIPTGAIVQQRSGFRVSDGWLRMVSALTSRDNPPSRPVDNVNKFPIGDPYPFITTLVLTDQYCPNPTTKTWSDYRQSVLLERGLPIPYYKFDVIDTEVGEKARADYSGFLRDAKSSDPIDVLSPLMSEDVATGVGFLPSADSDAPTILRQMCVRCHTGTENSSTRRARFDARNLDKLRPETMEAVMQRVQLPEGDPGLMPPRRSGQLPAWAIDRIKQYFASR